MAKTSKIVANDKRKLLVARYAERRAALKEQIRTAESPEQAVALSRQLAKLPRNSSATRLRNRDNADGRPRGHIRKVGLSRVNFRKMAHDGHLPGITKSSW